MEIPMSFETRYLGVEIDSKLTLNSHSKIRGHQGQNVPVPTRGCTK